jgi:geranylgeranyl diphosphate synthase type 3
LSYTRQILEELDDEAVAEVAKLGGNPMLEFMLDKMLEWKRWAEENKPEE